MDEKIDQLRDLKVFAQNFFIIRGKSGNPQPLVFNVAQSYIDKRLEAQRAATGRVRAIILKGRQQGCSTYIQSRYFHRIITTKGKKAFILTHEAEATKNLFEMTKRYYENLPTGLCPEADTSSAKEIYFKCFDSGYSVGTAGNRGVGRSQTIQLFHGSEVAYWPNSDDHVKGVMQAISSDAGTEIILESTANGIGNYFHQAWIGAMQAQNGFQAIFVPWYWQTEYRDFTAGLSLTEEEEELLKIYNKDGLTKEHIGWRRLKIAEFSPDHAIGLERFKQEYPMTPDEAFQNPIANIFIPARYVMRARKAEINSDASLIIGVDPAVGDNDRTAIIRRKGRLAYQLESFRHHNTMEIAGRLKLIIEAESPSKVFIDCIGIGAGVVDRLREMGYDFVVGINVARSANVKERFRNLRAELWSEMKDWLMQEMPVQIPDSDELHGDLCSLGYKHTSSGQLQIESKDDLRARNMPSCDTADALMLTFASGQYAFTSTEPVRVMPVHHRTMFT